MPTAAAQPLRSTSPTRAFGRYALRRVLGKSAATMLWLADDSQTGAETMLTMPRVPPPNRAAVGRWLLGARRAARLDHPDLAGVDDCGVVDHWPYVAVARDAGVTLDEWLHLHPSPSLEESTGWMCSVLRGLAFAHDAGLVHGDVQLHGIVVDERGQARVMALAVAPSDEAGSASAATIAIAAASLRDQRAAAERDVLGCGLVLHRLLAGAAALGSADVAHAIERMAPLGREIVRLPFATPQPVADALRAIVNRSTAGQARLRYRNARTFLGALTGWRSADDEEQAGPVEQLIDRLQVAGHLPARADLGRRVQRLTAIGRSRTDEIARLILPDLALSFELLRTLHSARVQGTQIAGNGAVLTLRRVVALIGEQGVRAAANTLRPWPGALDEHGAKRLEAAIERVRLAGHLAEALRPRGYDGEVVHLASALQSLGRLALAYHFADEAEQIRQLMLPAAAPVGDALAAGSEQPGLSEEAAAFAVLGVGIDAFDVAVARHWGFSDEVQHLIRRLPADAPVRKPDNDADTIRIVASAANEIVDALQLPSARVPSALQNVLDRYGKILQLTVRTLKDAIDEAREALAQGRAVAESRPSRDEEEKEEEEER